LHPVDGDASTARLRRSPYCRLGGGLTAYRDSGAASNHARPFQIEKPGGNGLSTNGVLDTEVGEAMPKIRVMVVDDLPSFRRVARTVIDATVGFESIRDAASGPEALAFADRLDPDLVLVDVRMPEMGGIEAARRLHESHPDTMIVLISLEELPDAAFALASCGAVAFVRKRDFGTRTLRRLWAVHGPSHATGE
jgi:CheY-like chemotaxis protein